MEAEYAVVKGKRERHKAREVEAKKARNTRNRSMTSTPAGSSGGEKHAKTYGNQTYMSQKRSNTPKPNRTMRKLAWCDYGRHTGISLR